MLLAKRRHREVVRNHILDETALGELSPYPNNVERNHAVFVQQTPHALLSALHRRFQVVQIRHDASESHLLSTNAAGTLVHHNANGWTLKPAILIAGAGMTGIELARRLATEWRVILVDKDPHALASDELNESVERYEGDATSALVLKHAGIESVSVVAATTGSDEHNLEIAQIARDKFGIEQRHALMHALSWEPRYRENTIHPVDRFHACASQIATRVQGGRKIATDIGLGEGEIFEVEVQANSSIIGRRLAELHPQRWRIGAIYRGGALVVPRGETTIERGDRIVLIGEPDIVSSIATYIGTGEAQFPLHYGSNIVALGSLRLNSIAQEATHIIDATAAKRLNVLVSDHSPEIEAARAFCTSLNVPAAVGVIGRADTRFELAAEVSTMDAGLVLLQPEAMGFLCRIGLLRSRLVQTLDRLMCPVLVCRGSAPYRRVLLALAEKDFYIEAARLAIDLVRMTRAELHLGVVHQHELVQGSQLRGEMEERRGQVEDLARMYKVALSVVTFEGNPIDQLVRASCDYDLVVLPYERHRKSFLTRPDVGQNLIHRVACSALVMPCADGTAS